MSQYYYGSIVCDSTRKSERERENESASVSVVSVVAETAKKKCSAHSHIIKSTKCNVQNEPIDLKDYKLRFNRITSAIARRPTSKKDQIRLSDIHRQLVCKECFFCCNINIKDRTQNQETNTQYTYRTCITGVQIRSVAVYA